MSNIFPNNFLWGTATSAHQVEGNNIHNDIWLLEQVPGSPFVEPSGIACDHFHRYEEDIALLAGLGLTAYRFSLEWSRIEPREGEFSQQALDHYRRVLRACHTNGITPVVTFHHIASPAWLIRAGGWEDEKTPVRFASYCARVTQELGHLFNIACTINEPNLAPLIDSLGGMPRANGIRQAAWWQRAAAAFDVQPEKLAPFLYALSPQARKIILHSHKLAVEAIKSISPDILVGMTLIVALFEAANGGQALATKMDEEVNLLYLRAARGDDFVGVQTYSRILYGPDGPMHLASDVERTQMGYEFYPEVVEAAVRKAIETAGIPAIITEQGVATEDDGRRIVFLQRALQSVANCLADDLDVRGYFYWSAFDNFEWTLGYGPQFGLIGVDRQTQERTVKLSASWLGNVARSNGKARNKLVNSIGEYSEYQ